MTISWKKIGIIIFIISIMGICGCNKKVQKNTYDTILSSLSAEQSYAFVEFDGYDLPTLLVTGETYEFDCDIEAGIYGDVYYAWDEKVENLGRVESLGTAYPIKYDDGGIYAGGPHFVAKYVLNFEKKQLELAEFAKEVFDENGKPTYIYSIKEEEKVADDDFFLISMIEKYGEATVVNFGK